MSVTSDVTDGGVSLGAQVTTPGTPGTSSSVIAPPSRTVAARSQPSRPVSPVLGSAQCRSMVGGKCRASSPAKNPPTPAPRATIVRTPPTPPRTVSDVAQFRPQGSSFVVEPDGWSLPRVPTNVYSQAQEHTLSGQLLGWPVEVRFTPVAYHWDYGDGHRARSASGGGTWGGSQFSSTSTSHVYAQPGIYVISLTVEYRASFRFSGGTFQALAGSVNASGGSRQVEVCRVTPVLGDRGCDVSTLTGGRC